MNLKFWEKQTVSSALNDTEIKVLSRYLINQQDIINSLTEQNQQLTAEVQVLREVVDDLSNINSKNVNRAIRVREAHRKTSPFRK